MSVYTEFFLKANSAIVQYELLTITHSSFSQDYNIVRNNTSGITVDLESGPPGNGATDVDFEYYPLKISHSSDKNDLDFALSIQLGDLGETIPDELDNIAGDNTFLEKPVVIYRTYRSDDLTEPLHGPFTLQIGDFIFDRSGVSFSAKAPSININDTGERYTFTRFPMLRGFL